MIAFVVNNLLWMAFVYVFTPNRKKEPIHLPRIKLPEILKKKPTDDHIEDLTMAGISAKDVLASMKEGK